MKVSVETRAPEAVRSDLLAIPLEEAKGGRPRPPARLRALDRALGGVIGTALGSGDFRGRRDESALLYPTDGPARRVLLLGLGDPARLDAEALRKVAGRAVANGSARGSARVGLVVPPLRRLRPEAAAQALAEGAVLGGYRFDAYKQRDEDAKPPASQLHLYFPSQKDLRAARRGVREGVILAESQNVARRLSNEPPNALPPVAMAREARRTAREVGLRSRVLDVPAMKRQGMGAILAVGGGSVHPPRLIVLEHVPRSRGTRRPPTVCVVGKGITFDTGGISIKPSQGMEGMKHDMSGGAAVVGILRAAALLELPLHVVGIIAAAENMPGGKAYRPSDIVRSMSGKTIEILNTDAEGRVVLADALHYATTKYEPRAIVDLATLTGACIVALGKWTGGLFTEDDDLAERLRAASDASGERVWRLPLFEEHKQAMRSQVADLHNTGGRDAGASTAAGFLSAFVGETPWAHLDIAGMSDTDKPGPYQPRGATGFGVRLVVEMLRGWTRR